MVHSERLAKWTRWGLGLGVLGAVIFGPGVYELARLSLLQQRLDRRMAELSVQHERLTQEQQRLRADPTYVEGIIRSTFKVARPGELVVPLATTAALSSRDRSDAQ